jgi:hypothetical protein
VSYQKNSFSIFELIVVVAILAIIASFVTFKKPSINLDLATKRVVMYLKYTRYLALKDNKYDPNNSEWFKSLWTFKFQRCKKSVGGLYFVIYSDSDGASSHFKKRDTAKDPINDKFLYSNNDCEADISDESRYILLTKEYGITDVKVSCNSTNSIGQISFNHDGKIYSKLNQTYQNEITQPCFITLYADNQKSVIRIEPITGYIM